MKHLPFITIFEKKAIFINEGNPIKLFNDNYIFRIKVKKIYINSVGTKKGHYFFYWLLILQIWIWVLKRILLKFTKF